jgi:hypothetical protein
VNLPVRNGKYRKLGGILVTTVGFAALAIWLFHFCLWYQYAATRPSRPDASSGRIYPLNTHGSIAYLNKDEDGRLTALTVSAVGLFLIAFVMHGVLVDGFRQPMPWEKKKW